MYKVIWDAETNGILLTDKTTVSDVILFPRPVFFEELDLLGFDKNWKYPKVKEPLLWANGRRYFYKGEWIAEAKGGNIYESPQIVFMENGKKLALEPIALDLMIKKNQEAIFVLENEAMDFVEHTYKVYKKGRNKVDWFAVSFSGGKDSQTVLDIISRVVPPDEYIVVFTDTDMELPSTHKIVNETKTYYQNLYPELRFDTARGNLLSVESWREFGPPSRIHRWCCSVYKTSPFARFIKTLSNGNRQPRILVFEGVRGDESVRRGNYHRIAEGVKHINIINNRPIINWNEPEVFLYLFYRNIKINDAYRNGLQRVGCSICPFASEWSESIIKSIYPRLADKYLKIIKEYVGQLGIMDKSKITNYIAEGQWKKRAGGRGISLNGTRIDFIKNESIFEAVISEPRENFLEWIKTVGKVFYREQENKFWGEIKIKDEIFEFDLEKKVKNNKQIIKVKNADRDAIFLSKLKKILYKSTYCVHCGSCEAECPTGALRITPNVKIDLTLCAHCGNCSLGDRGCLVAKSLMQSDGGVGMSTKTSGIDKYSTFGMRREWVGSFLDNPESWFVNNALGPKQKDAMVNWLKDAELIDNKTKKYTKLCTSLQEIYLKNELLVWAVLWVNLYYNSNIVKWYILNTEWHREYSKNELLEMVKASHSNLSEGTVNNPLSALINMFDKTHLGNELKLGLIKVQGNKRYLYKMGTDDIHPTAIAYSLYRYAQGKSRYAMTVSEFYIAEQKEGPYRFWGISKERLENILRYLQENKNGIVRVDLSKGLDNIHLREDLKYTDVLELLVREAL